MDQAPAVPVRDDEVLRAFGITLRGTFEIYERDRRPAEEQWLRNLRQRRGIYDPETLKNIPADMSRAYPKLTDSIIVSTIARLMQMLFPQTEDNFQVKESPMPDLEQEQLQQVLDSLVAEKAEAQGIQPSDVFLDTVDIEKAIVKYAAGRAERMHLKVRDDLAEMEYVALARKVVQSGATYNVGVLKGPLHTAFSSRTWKRDPNTGKYTAYPVQKFKPLFEFLPVWNWYPDMSAVSLDKQDGTFERQVLTRGQIEELAKRPDFFSDVINKWLDTNRTGNYRARWWETEIRSERKGDRSAVTVEGRKYEVVSYWGAVIGKDLKAAGVAVPESELGRTFHGNVWMLDSAVIKMMLAPLGDEIGHYHPFVFEEDDINLLGTGMCEKVRDTQLSLCATHRAIEDNLSVIGPAAEVNVSLLKPGSDTQIRKHKTWLREEESASLAGIPAVRDITINSHINELLAFRDALMETAGRESGLPAPSTGDVSGGGSEALRTQANASMFLGAAALPVRDTVRNYDRFTISVIKALVRWNRKYAPDPSRDGDVDVIARGSTSLIAKEVLGAALDALRQTITEDEVPHIKTRGLLMARVRARDIPVDDVLEDEDIAKANIQRMADAQARAQEDQQELVKAQVRDIIASAIAKIAKAHKDDASIQHDAAALLIEALGGERLADAKEADVRVKAASAAHAMRQPAAASA